MIVNKKLAPALKRVLVAAAAVFALTQCTQDEELQAPAAAAAAPEVQISASAAKSITSLTVSGVNTVFSTATDCKTCTYVVPEGTTVVDGKELGFQPGNNICLNTAFQYGALELTNIEGTEQEPIVITTVGTASEAAQVVASGADPY